MLGPGGSLASRHSFRWHTLRDELTRARGRIKSQSEQQRFLWTDYQMRGEQVERRLAAILSADVAATAA
jgi:hypothetical protein